jgi:small neutral amino acid transporter SnatA (MarC family)
MSEVTYYIKIFIAISVLVNPIEGIPLFLTKTGIFHDQKISIAKKTSVAVLLFLLSLYISEDICWSYSVSAFLHSLWREALLFF